MPRSEIDDARIVTLAENTTCREDLFCEHRLSLYIETGKHRILFDAGQTDAFAHNAEKLGIDLAKADFAILSHGHYDHGGGLRRFLEINKTAPVYIHRDAFMPHYNSAEKYIGLDETLLDTGRLIFAKDTLEIARDMVLCSSIPLPHPIDPAGLTVWENGNFKLRIFTCANPFSLRSSLIRLINHHQHY